MGIIQSGLIFNNSKNASIDGHPLVKGICIQGNVVYKLSSDTSVSLFFDFENLSNVSVIDGIWDKQYQLIYNTESFGEIISNIFFDFAELSNVGIVDGIWDSQTQLIYTTEVAFPIVPNIFFDFESLSNISVVDGVWDIQYQLIYNTEVI